MKIVLQKDVKNLGKVGDMVKVANGYARNFLLKRKMALVATEKNVKQWNHIQKIAGIKSNKEVEKRQEVLNSLSSVVIELTVQGRKDKIFGSVTNTQLAALLEEKGFDIDKRDIMIDPIKTPGSHSVPVKLKDLSGEFTVKIEIDKASAKKAEEEEAIQAEARKVEEAEAAAIAKANPPKAEDAGEVVPDAAATSTTAPVEEE